MDRMFFVTILGSGSAGNCALVETPQCRLLIDGGLSARQIVIRLAQCGVNPLEIDGLLLTHEHGDHTGALNVWGISTLTGGINIGGAGAYYSSNLTYSYSGGWKYIASDYGAMLYFGGSNGTSLYVAPTGTAGATAAIVQAWNVTPAGAMTVYGPLTCAGTISAGTATFTGGLFVSGGTFAPGMLYSDGNWGMLIRGQTRAVDADLALCNGAGRVSGPKRKGPRTERRPPGSIIVISLVQ